MEKIQCNLNPWCNSHWPDPNHCRVLKDKLPEVLQSLCAVTETLSATTPPTTPCARDLCCVPTPNCVAHSPRQDLAQTKLSMWQQGY